MALPKRADGTLDWKRIKLQRQDFWHLSEDELAIAQQSTNGGEDGEPPYLIEDLGDLGRIANRSTVGQMKMMFDDIESKHHPDGFDFLEI